MSAAYPYGGKSVTTARLMGNGTQPLNVGWGLNPSALAHANTDTALFDPSTEARTAGTSSQVTTNANNPNDTYQVTGTITAAGARVIQEVGLFDVSTAAPQTTANGAISSSGATSITVASASGFPGSGNYDIQVDQEVMTVTAGQGTTTWTVTRGAHGSTAATHANGVNIVGGTTTSGGNAFMLADHSAVNLNSGDSIAYTCKVEFT